MTITKHFRAEVARYCLLSLAGGAVGFYCLTASDIFATAQTGNVLGILRCFAGGVDSELVFRTAGFLLFAAGISISFLIPKRIGQNKWDGLCFLSELVCVLLLMATSKSPSPAVRVMPAFYFGAIQYHTYNDCCGVAVSTMFITNNLRQVILTLLGWKFCGDEKQKPKFIVFAFVTAAFILGSTICFLLYDKIGIYLLFAPAIALSVAEVMRREQIKAAA